MKIITLILLVSSLFNKSYSQKVTLQFKPDLCSETVYSVYDLLIDGKTFCGLLKPYQFKISNISPLTEKIIKKYPYYNFSDLKNFWDIKITALIVLNNQLLIVEKDKEKLGNYYQSDIKEIYSLSRYKAIKKYGWKYGKKGALIIKTK